MVHQAPPPAQLYGAYLSDNNENIHIAAYTCITAFVLFGTFFIIATRFRLWHTNWLLENIAKLVDNPVTALVGFWIGQLTTAQYRNDLYLIWLVVLVLAYENVLTISAGSTPGSSWILRGYVSVIYNIYLGFSINNNKNNDGQEYHIPLLLLWLFVLVKFTARLGCHKLMMRAYGLCNSKLVTDYMKIEHELTKPNEVIDPTSMKGYKYLVVGEGKINAKFTRPQYTTEIKLPASVVTVENVWSCNERLLDRSIDVDNRLRDICLSFAFFKLLKRRFYEYPAAEAQLEKTRQLVFEGLLSHDNDRVYRIIAMEIGFVRDFFYTRYPVTFAFGFPVFHVISLMGMLAVSLWISALSFHRREDPQDTYLWSVHHRHNIDYTITNIILIIVSAMEALETLSYVFSDWTKVILICRHVRRWMPHTHCFFDKVFAIICMWKFPRSLNNTMGQYSLLRNYNKSHPHWLRINCTPCSTWWWSPLKVAPNGMKEDKAVVLSPDVKGAILGSLRLMNSYPTNGVSSLKRNEVYDDLAWTCGLETEFHTLIVWHLATDLCGIHPVKDGGNKSFIQPHHQVASNLSSYCAYLMVFIPDMLPESIFSVKLFFREILLETKEFFNGACSPEDKYNRMMQVGGSGNGIIDTAARLGRQLMKIPDDVRRWKIMADFWSEFIIFLAPFGKEREHLKKLESGGEFITHLWALLYHAGIVEPTSTVSSGFHP